MPPPAGSRVLRALCAIAGMLLVADASFLMAGGVFSLGVTLPFGIGAALLALAMRWHAVHRWLAGTPARRSAWRLAWILFWLWVGSVAAFWVWLARQTSVGHDARAAAAAIVVLGSGTPGGQVSPTLAARLDTAYARAGAGAGPVVVASGGVDFTETRSEAAVMGDYLRAKGLAPARIVQEERSTSTQENLLFSRALLRQRGIDVAQASIDIVTSDFHTLRARWIARRAGYGDVHAFGAPTPLYLRYNAWLREYFAVLAGFVLREF